MQIELFVISLFFIIIGNQSKIGWSHMNQHVTAIGPFPRFELGNDSNVGDVG